MAMGMGIQPTATPPMATTPPRTATLTSTVRAITDIDGPFIAHTGAIAAPTMPVLTMAGAIDAPTMPARTAWDIAGRTGGKNRAVQAESLLYLTACAGIVERSLATPRAVART
jgi:hypothetical protein